MGSSLYRITVSIREVAGTHWQAIARDCARSIDTLVELLQGQLSTSVMERITRPGTGLFPSPKEIAFSCNGPASAAMCKHVVATLYGIGARLDVEPELLFGLRKVDAKELIARAGEGGHRFKNCRTLVGFWTRRNWPTCSGSTSAVWTRSYLIDRPPRKRSRWLLVRRKPQTASSASGRRVGNLERLDDVVRLIASSGEARHQISYQ